MKKQTLLFISFIIASLSFAQTQPSFGLRGGLSSSSVKGEAVSNLQDLLEFANGMVTTNNRTGLYMGTYATVPVSEIFSIEPALYYSQKGYEMRGDINVKGINFLGANAKAQLHTQYIDLPVVVKANLNGLQLFAGPQVSYLVNANLRSTAGLLGLNVFKNKMDVTEQFNRWDAGITGGVGYQFGNGVNITAAYDHGLMRADAGENTNAYNRAVKVGIGFNF